MAEREAWRLSGFEHDVASGDVLAVLEGQAGSEDPVEHVAQREVLRALAELPPRQRRALELQAQALCGRRRVCPSGPGRFPAPVPLFVPLPARRVLADGNGWVITQLAESVPFMSDDLPNRGTERGQISDRARRCSPRPAR